MKRTFTLMALLLAIGMAAAQEKNIRVVDCSKNSFETNVSSVLSKDRYEIDSLVVIAGNNTLTEKDILFMADCCKKGRLTGIDISRCYYVENNRIPEGAFASNLINAKPRRGEETDGEERDPIYINLRYITLSNGITDIGDNAFAYTNLEAITLPHWVKTIGGGAFAGCPNLKTVIIRGEEDKSQTMGGCFDFHPSGAVLKVAPELGERYRNSGRWDDFNIVESEEAFRVVEVDVADGQTLIDALGDDNMNADSLKLSGQLGKDDLELLGENTRYGRLVGIDFSDCVIEEGYIDFTKIKTIRMPRQMEKIPYAVFPHINANHLIMPESYKEICAHALEYTTGFVDSTLIVPEGCRRIGFMAFRNCKSLKRIVLPSSLEVLEISSLALNWYWRGDGVKVSAEVYVNRMYPPISSTKLEDSTDKDYDGHDVDAGPFGCGYVPVTTPDECKTEGWTLYVPMGAKKNYENDEHWSHFKTIIETPLLTGGPAGMGGITAVVSAPCAADGIYTLDGWLVAKGAQSAGLPKGLYVVKKNGVARKMLTGR